MKKFITISLLIISLGLLVPGISQPVLTLQGHIERAKIVDAGITMLAEEGDSNTKRMLRMFSSMLGLDKLEGEIEVYQKTRSILGTVKQLADNKNYLVAILVALFAIIIPVLKLLSQLLIVLLPAKMMLVGYLRVFAEAVSKWSMVDVFVIALIVAYLAGNAEGQMGDMLKMQAEFGVGFWFFTSYCLLAITASTLTKQYVKQQ